MSIWQLISLQQGVPQSVHAEEYYKIHIEGEGFFSFPNFILASKAQKTVTFDIKSGMVNIEILSLVICKVQIEA